MRRSWKTARRASLGPVMDDGEASRVVVANRILEILARQLFKALKGRVSLEELRSCGARAVVFVVGRWDGRGRFEAFAAQRIRWFLLRELRRELLRERRAGGMGQRIDLPSSEANQVPDVTQDVELHVLRREARRAVERLPEAEFALIDLYYYRGETMADLALWLGVSKSTVSERLARAMDRLRLELGHEKGGVVPSR